MFIMLLIRNFSFMTCVPVFMVLTGFLSGHFTANKKQLLRIANVVLVYVLCSIVCIVFRYCRGSYTFNIVGTTWDFVNFSAAPYSWYIEMHLGMMLMIPFLNVIYRHITKREKKILLLCCLMLTCMSKWIPGYLLFDYWAGLFPITYYFVGAYMAEYRPFVKRHKAFLIMTAVALMVTCANYFLYRGKVFSWPEIVGNGSLYTLVIATMLFQFIFQLDLSKLPSWATRLIRWAAHNTLPAYLLSYCFDQMVYPLLIAKYTSCVDMLPIYILVVPGIFICSLLAGQVITTCTAWLMRPVRYAVERIPTEKWLR